MAGAGPERPVPLTGRHELHDFCCGIDDLDVWLRQRALPNQQTGASRTFVLCDGPRVIGYYCLSSAQLHRPLAVSKMRRNMPEQMPAILVGRLAIDRRYQGRGFGGDLVFDAVRHVVEAVEHMGIRLIMVHAISDEAVNFYKNLGFESSPVQPRTLMITMADAEAALGR